jgi:DNA-directed RNA polymerase specialized sigma24 family protein
MNCGMSARVAWIAAQREPAPARNSHPDANENIVAIRQPWAQPEFRNEPEENGQEEYERRTYRDRTVAMLRRYMRYAMETGRLPSVLGREFFRAKVTTYTVVTFEDRVIFVHDMETCLDRLDEFSRELIARHVLQEHDRWATARLLQCNEKTVRRLTPLALDQLSEILLDMGLMERIEPMERLDPASKLSCQGGDTNPNSASDCEKTK